MHGNDSWWCDQFSHSIILTNVGIYCIASAVARFWHFILRVVGFAFVVICGGECVSNAWHPARVNEWIPVCTGMTAGGAINSLTPSSSRTWGSIRQHPPSLTLFTTIPATYVHFP
ncbi:hypothetical protein [Vibrio vulnificus]|uniref:hypothetical protein n=1 Tax=Vibrio vulnificus TaxID=672 RepID=UPI00155DB900|nr:hypothetical protein [Vibrio vulnificus]